MTQRRTVLGGLLGVAAAPVVGKMPETAPVLDPVQFYAERRIITRADLIEEGYERAGTFAAPINLNGFMMWGGSDGRLRGSVTAPTHADDGRALEGGVPALSSYDDESADWSEGPDYDDEA